MRTSTVRRVSRVRRSPKMKRLEARISSEQKALFQQAASVQGRSLTEFIVSSLQKAAESIIHEHHLMTLSARDRQVFVDALLSAPVPSKRLRAAAQRYKSTGV